MATFNRLFSNICVAIFTQLSNLVYANKSHRRQIGDKYQVGDKSAINDQIGDKSAENTTVEQKLDIIIEYMQTHSIVTVTEMADVLSIKTSRTRDYLRMLVERGILIANGANKNRTYKLRK
ncbi:MAG: hypothetical protein IJ776_00655 [Paludibacteraceae bacterium]|nr:hypothetical protein [Paludibacteraceae bacterium]